MQAQNNLQMQNQMFQGQGLLTNPFSQQSLPSLSQPMTFHDMKPSLPTLISQQDQQAQGLLIPDFATVSQQQQQQTMLPSPPMSGPTSPQQQNIQQISVQTVPITPVSSAAQFIQPVVPVSSAGITIKQEPNSTPVMGANGKVLTQILPNPQPSQQQQNLTIQNNKLFSFAGMPIATSAGIFATTAGGNAILLPNLQLAVVQSQQDANSGSTNSDKLPMKRLTPNNHQHDGKLYNKLTKSSC